MSFLFPKNKIVKYNDLKVADPNRKTIDFSDPAYQAKANESAGYQPIEKTDISTDGTLYMYTEGDTVYRAQNRVLWAKPKKK